MSWRADFNAIIDAVPQGAKVLDIGCNDGQLLEILQNEKNAIVRGMEISQNGVNACVAKGLSVIQGDADLDLGLFPNDAFDVVVLSNTIQATQRPQNILKELRRIGHKAIISVPNFGYWQVRLYLLKNGRMPITKDLPEAWYETSNIHLCSLNDFSELALKSGFKIEKIIPTNGQKIGKPTAKSGLWVNLLSEHAVFVLNRV